MKKLFFILSLSSLILMMSACEFPKTDNSVFNDECDSTEVVSDTVAVKDSIVRCKGITKRGTQCECLLDWPDTLCFQHVGQAVK